MMGLVEIPVNVCLARNTSGSARDGPRLRQCRSRSDDQVVLPPARTCRLRDGRDVAYRPSPKSVWQTKRHCLGAKVDIGQSRRLSETIQEVYRSNKEVESW